MVLAILVGGCSYAVQTTSGEDYLARASTIKAYASKPISASIPDFDARIRRVAAVEPILRFPARIGLARIQRGRLSSIPQPEADAWFQLAEKLGPDFGEFVPVSRLIAEMVANLQDSENESSRVHSVMEKIRLGAARQHLDVVLIYEVYGTSDSRLNPLAIADFTLIGAFIVPGRSVEATGYATALLVDVRNGYPYGTADTSITRQGLAPAVAASERRRDLDVEAGTEAAIALTGEVETMMARLAAILSAL